MGPTNLDYMGNVGSQVKLHARKYERRYGIHWMRGVGEERGKDDKREEEGCGAKGREPRGRRGDTSKEVEEEEEEQ